MTVSVVSPCHLEGVGAQSQTAEQDAGHEEKRVRFAVREGQFDEEENQEGDAEEHPVVPGKARVLVISARADIHRDRSDHPDRVEPGQCSEAGRCEQDQ